MCRHKRLDPISVPAHAPLPALRADQSSIADISRCEVGLTIVRHVSLPLRVLSLFYGDIAIVRLRNLLCRYCYIFVILDQN